MRVASNRNISEIVQSCFGSGIRQDLIARIAPQYLCDFNINQVRSMDAFRTTRNSLLDLQSNASVQ